MNLLQSIILVESNASFVCLFFFWAGVRGPGFKEVYLHVLSVLLIREMYGSRPIRGARIKDGAS